MNNGLVAAGIFLLIIGAGILAVAGFAPPASTTTTTGVYPSTGTTITAGQTTPYTLITAQDQNGNDLPAVVSVDGSVAGHAPIVAELASGTHTITCAPILGYASGQVSFTVQGGQQNNVVCTYTTSPVVTSVTTSTNAQGSVTVITSTSTVTTSSVSPNQNVQMIISTEICVIQSSCTPYSGATIKVYSSPSSSTVLQFGTTNTAGQLTLNFLANSGSVYVVWSGNGIIQAAQTVTIGSTSPIVLVLASSGYGLCIVGSGCSGSTTYVYISIALLALGAFSLAVGTRSKFD